MKWKDGQAFLAQWRTKSEIPRFPEHTKGKNVGMEGTCGERKSYVNSVPT